MRKGAMDLLSVKLGVDKTALRMKYEIVGKAMLMKDLPDIGLDERKLGYAIRASFKLWSVYRILSIEGETRVPSTRLISGIRSDVTHFEEGVIYRFDPSRIMFSKGNKRERHRLLDMVSSEETVLDMFAGIGYFSIPLSKKAREVFACEINPVAFHYLLVNKRLNGSENLRPMLGDSSLIRKSAFADRIVMGHFSSISYLPKALEYLKPRGFIHLHALVPRGGEEKISSKLLKLRGVNDLTYLKVKGYSPRLNHIVFDLSVRKS
ncbi:MAG: class I SAM-dependent methyltransferase [Thermoplasmata archaeon]